MISFYEYLKWTDLWYEPKCNDNVNVWKILKNFSGILWTTQCVVSWRLKKNYWQVRPARPAGGSIATFDVVVTQPQHNHNITTTQPQQLMIDDWWSDEYKIVNISRTWPIKRRFDSFKHSVYWLEVSRYMLYIEYVS